MNGGASEYLPDVDEIPAVDDSGRVIEAPRPLSRRSPGEIVTMEFDDSDVILGDRLLAKGQPMTILGQGGLGKSRLVTQMAACCVTGRPFLHLKTSGRDLKWLFLQTENSNRRLQHDLFGIRRWLGEEFEVFSRQCCFHTLEHDEDYFLNVDSPESLTKVRELVSELRPDVIVWDPLNAFTHGDLNKDADMRNVLQAISRVSREGNADRGIVIVHHALTGKTGAAKAVGFDRASFGRNSKSLHAWTRGQINLAAADPDTNDRLVISCGKCSNGQEFEPMVACLDKVEMTYRIDPDFSIENWQAEMNGASNNRKVSLEAVVKCCKKSMTKRQLVRAIMDETGCAKSVAYEWIEKAVKRKRIRQSDLDQEYTTVES